MPPNECELISANGDGLDRRRQRAGVAVTGIDLGEFVDTGRVDTDERPAVLGDLIRGHHAEPRFPLPGGEEFDESARQPVGSVVRFVHLVDVAKLLHRGELELAVSSPRSPVSGNLKSFIAAARPELLTRGPAGIHIG